MKIEAKFNCGKQSYPKLSAAPIGTVAWIADRLMNEKIFPNCPLMLVMKTSECRALDLNSGLLLSEEDTSLSNYIEARVKIVEDHC